MCVRVCGHQAKERTPGSCASGVRRGHLPPASMTLLRNIAAHRMMQASSDALRRAAAPAAGLAMTGPNLAVSLARVVSRCMVVPSCFHEPAAESTAVCNVDSTAVSIEIDRAAAASRSCCISKDRSSSMVRTLQQVELCSASAEIPATNPALRYTKAVESIPRLVENWAVPLLNRRPGSAGNAIGICQIPVFLGMPTTCEAVAACRGVDFIGSRLQALYFIRYNAF